MDDSPAPSKPTSPLREVYDFLSGFKLATLLLLLLGLLTWFATLEQIDKGLYPTLNKYFHWQALWLLPEINGKIVPLPLPGGYWVSALLLINMTLGGIIRIRKGWRQAGNLIAHFGIIFMLLGGGVAHHFSERGNMAIEEGTTSDTAEDYFEFVVEVAEIIDGKPENIHVIRGSQIRGLTSKRRDFILSDFPFDLQLGGYLRNALPVSASERAPDRQQPVADGYWLMDRPDEVNAEMNLAAIYGRVLREDATADPPFIVAAASFHPFTVHVGERVFTVDMRKRLWPMPFTVRLDEFTADFHPGTQRPAKFISEITRIKNDSEAMVTIQMNEPMRYSGLTFFQASYGPPGAGPGDSMYSVFEIVHNPADKWPEYALYVVTLGMLITFLTKLGESLARTTRRTRKSHG
ncbi:MAG: cytochrome c biogenesis protein ResB [Luteolibacter sp.]|jgi:hypothetical protein